MAGAQMYAAMEYQLLGDMEQAKLWARKAKKGLAVWSGQGHEYYQAVVKILGEEEAYKKD